MSNDPFFQSIMVLPGMQPMGGGGTVVPLVAPQTAPAPTPLTHDWRRWVAENVLRGMSGESIAAAMVRDGIDRETAAREINAAQSHPYVEAAAGVRSVAGIAPAKLAKRDWVLEIYRRSARFDPATAEVHTVHRPTREAFLRDYYAANRPVLIEGAMDDWPAMSGWTMENLRQRFGDKLIEAQAGRTADANYELNSAKLKTEMRFSDYIDKVVGSGRTNDFYMTANNSGKNREALGELWNDIIPFPEYLRQDDPGNRGFFWFGPAGIVTPLHHDLTNNFMAQVVGRKLVKLIAPCELANLYNHHHCYSQVDLNNIDYERFPLFRNVRVIDVVLNPGQVLFLPIGWWHHVTGMDISITMTFTNFVFDNDFHSFYTTYSEI